MIALFVLKLSAGITLMWLLMPRKDVTDGFFRIQMRLLLGTTVLTTLLLSSTTTWPQGLPKRDARGSREVQLLPQSGAQAVSLSPVLPDGQGDARVGDVASGADVVAEAGEVVTAGVASADQVAGYLRTLQIIAAFIAYPGSIFWALGRRLPGNICIFLLALVCTASVLLHSACVPGLASRWLQVGSDVASSLVLGSTLTAMLLGHWYLTTPAMSIKPLWWFNRMLILSAVLRLAFSCAALWQFGFDGHDLTRWLWLILRLAGGGLVPAIVSFLVWRILKYRNTQSATGVLFAGLILVFMGEMTAALLERDVQIPY